MKTTRNILLLSITTIAILSIGYYFTATHNNKKIVHAIIFDMDGTIINTDPLWKAANRYILDEHAPHLSSTEKDEIIASFQHLTFYEIWTTLQKNYSIPMTLEEIAEDNTRHVHTMYEIHGISFIPKFDEFHTVISQLGIKTAIATSSQEKTVNIILNTVPLRDYFGENIYHVDHVNKAFKPKPDVYLHAAKMLEVQPCNCIAIEDSSSGIKAAKAAGMYCIGINTGKNRKLLEQADEIVECFSEIDLQKFNFISVN
ncbi:HAD family phosphatase [Candidatus Babeliales bacterium]|nr:HAD family phosphatase [Candidatus Babeliales bacterium]MBP9844211.1 HAD family phosphatase [Candidatus Babeliales bacterium]